MKSIMEEASSIIKAIEKGWINAGQPKEFTVKVFEDVQKNFIGMTTRPAKIGIFYSEPQAQESQAPQKKGAAPQAPKKSEAPRAPQPKPQKVTPKQPVVPIKEVIEEEKKQPSEVEPRQLGPVWNEDMVESVQKWLHEIFALIEVDPLSFTIEPDHFLLKIHFEKNVYDDKTREKYLFSSLSMLLITMLKRHYKRPLKGYKVVLVGA